MGSRGSIFFQPQGSSINGEYWYAFWSGFS
jgi:hypothetical protein